MCATWKLEGYDTFSNESYPLGTIMLSSGNTIDGLQPFYPSYPEARAAAVQRLADLEREQPSARSGGQAPGGIQDHVYIVHPGGRRERVTS
jgi:hypothetical protein